MRGFPKTIQTKQDYENLLNMAEFRDQALVDLQRILSVKDRFVLKATELIDPKDLDGDWKTAKILNPNPLWKQKGFSSLSAVADLIKEFTS